MIIGIYGWIFTILVVLYGGLTVFTAYSQLKKEKITITPGYFMIIGGALIVLSAFNDDPIAKYSLVILILGLIFIHIAAIKNGMYLYGKVNIKHHIIRFVVSILLIVLSLLR